MASSSVVFVGAAIVSSDLVADHDRNYSRPALSDEKIALKLVKGATSAFENMSEKTREDLTGKLAAFTSMAEDYFKGPEAQRKHNDKGVHTLWLSQGASVAALLLFVFVAWLRAIIECDLIAIVLCGVSCAWGDFDWICVFYVVLVYVLQWARRDQFSRLCLEPSTPPCRTKKPSPVSHEDHTKCFVFKTSPNDAAAFLKQKANMNVQSWGTNSMREIASQAQTATSVGKSAAGRSTAVEDAQSFHDRDFPRATRSSECCRVDLARLRLNHKCADRVANYTARHAIRLCIERCGQRPFLDHRGASTSATSGSSD